MCTLTHGLASCYITYYCIFSFFSVHIIIIKACSLLLLLLSVCGAEGERESCDGWRWCIWGVGDAAAAVGAVAPFLLDPIILRYLRSLECEECVELQANQKWFGVEVCDLICTHTHTCMSWNNKCVFASVWMLCVYTRIHLEATKPKWLRKRRYMIAINFLFHFWFGCVFVAVIIVSRWSSAG